MFALLGALMKIIKMLDKDWSVVVEASLNFDSKIIFLIGSGLTSASPPRTMELYSDLPFVS